MKNISYHDIEELAAYITGNEYTEDFDVDQVLFDEFEISFDSFEKVVMKLLPMAMIAESPLTKKVYKGFADTKNSMWVLKIAADEKKS